MMNGLKGLYKSLTENPYLKGSDAGPVGRQKQYFAKESIDFIQSLGKYANNDYVLAITPWGQNEPGYYEVRVEDSFDEQANTKRGDDWKDILFYDDYPEITIGMMAQLEGCIWLGFNTRNIAALTSAVTVRRCDNVLNFVDEFGNVTPEPIVFDKYTVLNSTNITKPSDPATLINGYKNAWAQYNERTATLKTNDRFIIQGDAFVVRGVDKYSRQTTDDNDTVKVISFVLARTEEVEGDDLVNNIANATANVWEVVADAASITGVVGTNAPLGVEILHNGEKTTDYSIQYTSSDESIVQVNPTTGQYFILGEGTATVTCTFSENPNVYTVVTFTGVAEAGDDYFVTLNPETATIRQFETAEITGALYNGTSLQADTVTFSTSGVPSQYYTLSVDGNVATLYCKAPYAHGKLSLTASCEKDGETYSKTLEITLAGAF